VPEDGIVALLDPTGDPLALSEWRDGLTAHLVVFS
jgi:hypothetical protein